MSLRGHLVRALTALLCGFNICGTRTWAQSNATANASATTRYIFAFGDSYTATGFNASRALPAPGNPLGNPAYPGVTSSGYGNTNWIDLLVHDQAPSNTLCYNFAWFGATVARSPGDLPVGQYYTFEDQIQEFENVKNTAQWQASNTLFTSWFGVNDVALNTVLGITLPDGASAANRYDGIVTPYFDQLDTLYRAGARDYLVFTVPPIDRAPIAVAEGQNTVANTMTNISAFNQVLKDEAQLFLNRHPGSRISFVDTSIPFNQVLNNPTQYGTTNATCQDSDGHTCLWSNSAHPAVAIHQALSAEVYGQLNDLGFWNGMFNAGPVETAPQDSAASGFVSKGTLWMTIFLVGVAIGRSTGIRGRPWSRDMRFV